jgi:hypothetical protein
MTVRAICVVLLSLAFALGHSGAQPKAKPKAKKDEKKQEYSKVEAVGTVGEGTEPDRRQFQPNPFMGFRAYYTIKIKNGGEWRLELDDVGEKLLQRNVGKQIEITGTLGGHGIRVKTINGLSVE